MHRILTLCLALLATTELWAGPTWVEVEIGIIGTASDDILQSALDKVHEEGHDGLLLQLDTPGGALDATRSMVKKIMDSKVPVVIWVGPNGSRAASAGAFITLAGHIAAMAPGTNIGAAHPIQADGGDVENSEAARKIENDTVAFIESIAKARGRNTELAASFVMTSASITAEEALSNNIIDLMAESRTQLFEKIDGRKLQLSNQAELTLSTKDATFVSYEPTVKQEFLAILSNPNLFYLLFLAGLIGIGFELTHPGALFPGVVGAICMILALIATAVLPVSFGAMLLIVAGAMMLVAEMFIPSLGVLGIGGFVAFCVGSFLLVDPGNEQGLRISIWTILPSAMTVAAAALLVGYLLVRANRSAVLAGPETLMSDIGDVVHDFIDGQGTVRIQGEEWQAKGSQDLRKGDKIRVAAKDGLNLKVEKA